MDASVEELGLQVQPFKRFDCSPGVFIPHVLPSYHLSAMPDYFISRENKQTAR
jgi:hypothetical protein